MSEESIPIDHPLYDTLRTGVDDSRRRAPERNGAADAAGGGGGYLDGPSHPLWQPVYAIGGSAVSANLMGISTRSTTIRIYMLSTGLATLAGIVFSVYTQAGYALAGVGVELDAIASVVIGGTLLSGGVGTVLGTLFGVAIQGLIQTYINFDGTLSSWWTKLPSGFCCLFYRVAARSDGVVGKPAELPGYPGERNGASLAENPPGREGKGSVTRPGTL